MRVKTYGEAWDAVIEITKSGMTLDKDSTERAGYKVYRNEEEYYEYVCDLGDILELNRADGTTINIWYGEKQNKVNEDVVFSLVELMKNNCLNTVTNNNDAEVQLVAIQLYMDATQIIVKNGLMNKYKEWCGK